MRVGIVFGSMVWIVGCGGAEPGDTLSASGGAGVSAADADAGADTDSGQTPSTSGMSGASGPTATTGATTPGTASGTDGASDSASQTGSSTGAGSDTDAGSTTGATDPSIIDVTIFASNTCAITTTPASITVPLGTEFTVRWHNSPRSDVEVDIDKIDAFNQVPLIIEMPPGYVWHDDIRQWCGTLFTGTFDFRITSCFEPYYLPVDCGG